MGKGKGLTFTLFAVLGAITGYATYMASKDEFSEDTKEKVDVVLNKIKNVGNDIKRTYTSIGDKKEFESRTKELGDSSLKLAKKTGDLLASGASDMYKFTKSQVAEVIDKYNNPDDDTSDLNDDLDVNYVSTKGGKKKSTIIKKNTKKNKPVKKKSTKKTKK